MSCTAKLAKYQVPDLEWKCPKCGTGFDTHGEQFCVEESACEDPECVELHDLDLLLCTKCGYETSGKAFSARVAKANNLVPCPHCKGKGLVKKESTNE